MKTGLFFGTFNPVHLGHLGLARWFLGHTDLDEIWFVVSPHNPFKKKDDLLGEDDRLALCRLAVQGQKNILVSDEEFQLPKPSLTIRTLERLQGKHPEQEFVLLIGEDNLRVFHLWAEYSKILDEWEVWVYPRMASSSEKASPEDWVLRHPHLKKIEAPQFPISSTQIREAVKHGHPIVDFVTEAVAASIHKNKFYG
ncbi:MAG: nicotinate-nucleotide adenylyltransferase [Spirochaetia bacterium]|nr:nicotinate-nucleotide adenylyltransferase [Spirochaetia bacterium]